MPLRNRTLHYTRIGMNIPCTLPIHKECSPRAPGPQSIQHLGREDVRAIIERQGNGAGDVASFDIHTKRYRAALGERLVLVIKSRAG